MSPSGRIAKVLHKAPPFECREAGGSRKGNTTYRRLNITSTPPNSTFVYNIRANRTVKPRSSQHCEFQLPSSHRSAVGRGLPPLRGATWACSGRAAERRKRHHDAERRDESSEWWGFTTLTP